MRARIAGCLRGLDGLAPNPPSMAAAATGDFDLNPDLAVERTLTPAAVLVPIVERPSGYTVLLTQRTDHLHDHAGQISFPGGRTEDSDETPIDTALRETEEEIRLERRFIDVAGRLDYYATGTGYFVTPVVGFVTPGFDLKLDEFEVAEAFEVPLSFLLDEKNHHTVVRTIGGHRRRFYVMRYRHYHIWGATAGMIMNLFRRISEAS